MPQVSVQHDDVGTKMPDCLRGHTHSRRHAIENQVWEGDSNSHNIFLSAFVSWQEAVSGLLAKHVATFEPPDLRRQQMQEVRDKYRT